MYDNPKFAKLVQGGAPTGEVVAINRFLITVRGLGEVSLGSLVYFATGDQGYVREVGPELTVIMSLTSEELPLGTLAVLETAELVTRVGEALVGRVINALGQPIDGGGPIALGETAPVFAGAHSIIERQVLDTPLSTGVAAVDALFPLVLGQRIAILGDNKTGKSAFLAQLSEAQAGTGRIVVHVLIGKRRSDVERLVQRLKATGALAYSIVVVASVFDALTQSYLAPYVGAAIAEYLWHQGKDVIILYDDLTAHAKVYRELSLLLKVPPGRDSYPGDMFYVHSSLLERAGRLASNGATLTAVPVVLTPSDDITTYLPTGVMSITDGQIIFDAITFRQGIRPAVNVGLSVSRVGGRGQTKRQKQLTGTLFKALAAYRQAAELSHFGSELAVESRDQLELGKRLYEALKQPPNEVYGPVMQTLVLETVLRTGGKTAINIDLLKRKAKELAPTVTDEAAYEPAIMQLLAASTIQAPVVPAPSPAPAPAATTGGAS
jgi:F-type H+-transporting ATPase subunit alpha